MGHPPCSMLMSQKGGLVLNLSQIKRESSVQLKIVIRTKGWICAKYEIIVLRPTPWKLDEMVNDQARAGSEACMPESRILRSE